MQSSWVKLEIVATCNLHCPTQFQFTSYSISASPSVPLSYANKRTLLIFKLCRNCSANYQSFSTLPSDALELWPNICFLTLKLVGAGHAVCSVLSSVLWGVFPLRVFADFIRKFLAKVDVKWKNCQFLLFSYGEGKGAAGRQSGRVERNISTHKTFMRRTISGLASAELKRVMEGGGGEAASSEFMANCTLYPAVRRMPYPSRSRLFPLSAAR